MSENDIYIDWTKRPEGTTHLFIDNGIGIDGTPLNSSYWEKWDGGAIYEYDHCDGWRFYDYVMELESDDLEARIKMPDNTELTTSSNNPEERIEMPTNTKVVSSPKLAVALPDGSVTCDYLAAAQQWAAAFYELKDTLAQVKDQMKYMIENVDEILEIGKD